MKVIAFLIAFAAAAGLFLLFPEIDIGVSGLFYRPGEGFFLAHWPPARALYDLVTIISWTVSLAFIGWLVARALGPLKRLHVRSSAMIYIALSLAVGPGLISNAIMKENMGRARPAHVMEFGGEKRFTPAPLPADQCGKNCSFVSGHAATGFFLVTFAFLVTPGRWRRAAFGVALTMAAAISTARIVEGRHFLSDVVFAGFISFAVVWALYAFIGARDSPGGRVLARWEEHLDRSAEPGTLVVSQPHAFGAVLALCILSYIFFDRAALEWFLTFDWDLHLVFKWIADWGRQIFWAVPSGVAFIVLYLAAFHPRFKAQSERLKAWSILPLFIFTALSVTGIIGWTLKLVFGRMRPLHYYRHDDYGFSWFGLDGSLQSFPSGHAVTVATAMAAFCLIWPRFKALWIIFGTTLIAARVLETAHYISDALFGTYLGIALTAYLWAVFERSGVDFEAAKAGRLSKGEKLPWPERLGLPGWLMRVFRPAAAKSRKALSADPS